MQTRKGCFQECLGCEAKTEFNIAKDEKSKKDHILYAIEESGCLMRTCCPAYRNFTMEVSEKKGQQPFMLSEVLIQTLTLTLTTPRLDILRVLTLTRTRMLTRTLTRTLSRTLTLREP